MSESVRISPAQAKEAVASGSALLVCAYDSDDKFRMVHLDGAISLKEFREGLPETPRDREIIFYCA